MGKNNVSNQKTHANTILIVEKTLKSNHDFKTITDLYNALPSGILYATFQKVLIYLEESNKIAYDKNGVIFWIFAENKSGLNNLHKKSIPLK